MVIVNQPSQSTFCPFSGILDKSGTDRGSHQDSGFTDDHGGRHPGGPGHHDLSEEAIIQQHIARQLAAGE